MTAVPSVRVVRSGWPRTVHVAVHRRGEPREVLADPVTSIEEGQRVAEGALRARGQRVGQWMPIGPDVREALVFGGAP